MILLRIIIAPRDLYHSLYIIRYGNTLLKLVLEFYLRARDERIICPSATVITRDAK